MKVIQAYIHRHYESIKLFLLFVIVMLVSYILLVDQVDRSNRTEREDAIIIRVMEEIREENDTQTETIEEHFATTNKAISALCLLIIDVSGRESLERLEPETRERCESIASAPEKSAQPNGQPTKPEQVPQVTQPQRQQQPSRPDPTTSDPPEPEPDRVAVIDDILDLLRS